jgi:hypothetical protein
MDFGLVLHRISLDKQEAERCVVAEGWFRPNDEELSRFIERKNIRLIGSLRTYAEEHYEKSFVPLLRYSGNYNRPEVLIPFSVKARRIPYARIVVCKWRLRLWIKKKTGKRKN